MRYGWLVLSWGLLCMSFWQYHLGWAVFIALVPAFIFIQNTQNHPPRKVILALFAWSYSFNLFVLSWALQTNPGSWTGLTGWPVEVAVFVTWLIGSLVFSLPTLALGYVLTGSRHSYREPIWIAGFVSMWIIGEWGKSVLLSIMLWAPQGSIGPYWNFGVLGVAASSTPLVYAGRVVGLFGMSALVVLINYLIWRTLTKRLVPVHSLMAGLLLVITFAGYFLFGAEGGTARVGLLQLSGSNVVTPQKIQAYLREHPDVIVPANVFVLPEYSHMFDNVTRDHQLILNRILKPHQGDIISAGGEVAKSSRHSVAIVHRNENAEVLSEQAKTLLAPAGEYMPVVIKGVFLVGGRPDFVRAFNQQREIQRGIESEHTVFVGNLGIGALACTGILSPGRYHILTRQGAGILTSSSSLNVLQHGTIFLNNTKSLVRFSAVANDRAFVMASRSSPSYISTPDGDFAVETKPSTFEVRTAAVETRTRMTPYAVAGEWVLYLAAAVLLGVGVPSIRRQIRNLLQA